MNIDIFIYKNKNISMFIESIRKKFTDFDNKFIYVGYYRNVKKKSTIIEIKCKKCDCIIEKEQYTLLNRNKSLFCWECAGRKRPQRLDYDMILDNFIDNGCNNLKLYRNECNMYKVMGNCKCGNKFDKYIRRVDDFNYSCEPCAYLENGPHTEEEVRMWFIDNGLTPTFDKYRNTKQKLSYICVCGDNSSVKYSMRIYNPSDWKPMCKKCAIKHKMSGENASNWKGGVECDRFKVDWKWSRDVKRKFNMKCCITGICENLVSHHLNARSLGLGDHNNINNGVCISKELHIEFHRRYDKFKGTCTIENFSEFFLEKTNIKFNDYLKTIENED